MTADGNVIRRLLCRFSNGGNFALGSDLSSGDPKRANDRLWLRAGFGPERTQDGGGMKRLMVIAGSVTVLVAGVVFAGGSPGGWPGAPTAMHISEASTGNSNRKGKTITDGWQTDARGKPPA